MSVSIQNLHAAVSMDHSIEEYKRIIKSLSEKLKEVTVMNDKWQRYNDDREGYVEGLRKDLKSTRKQLQDREKELSETRARELQFQKTVKDQQTTIANFSKLMDDLDEKTDRERALVLRVQELEGEVKSLKRSQDRRQKNAEGVKLLQEQLESCIDDFKTERREKEKFKLEALTLRKKSTEKDNILRDYQEKISLIKSLEFPPIPRECHHQPHSSTRRQTNPNPRPHLADYYPQVKSNSWSNSSFFGTIEADATEGRMRESLSEGAMVIEDDASVIPVKPLSELFPDSETKRATEKSQPGSDSVFIDDQVDKDLLRH